jgi:hypothetical protein
MLRITVVDDNGDPRIEHRDKRGGVRAFAGEPECTHGTVMHWALAPAP